MRFKRVLQKVAAVIFLMHTSMGAYAQSFFDDDIPIRSIVAISYSIGNNQHVSGMGVYVGDSRVYTAAHIFNQLKFPDSPIDVLVIDRNLRPLKRIKAKVEKIDFGSDAAILALDDSSPLIALPGCENLNPKGSALIFVRFQGIGEYPITAWEAESRQLWADNLTGEIFLRGALDHGYSGGAALDQAGKCFLGVVSKVDSTAAFVGGLFPSKTTRSRISLVPVTAFTSPMSGFK